MLTTWITDWSDEEDAAFHRAFAAASASAGATPPRVLRSRPLGRTVGSRLHRLRSYPAYLALAVRALSSSGATDVVVAWQPLAGALVGLLRRRSGPALVVLNPLLVEHDGSLRSRLVLAGVRRADMVVLYGRAAAGQAVAAGIDAARIEVVLLGSEPRPTGPVPVDGPVLAAGRDHRDYGLLADAARAAQVEVRVAGPSAVPEPLVVSSPPDRAAFDALVAQSRAVVVPLVDDQRQAGTLAVLDALAAGRPVVATAGPGTVDYVPPTAGRLVPPGDVQAMAQALEALQDPETVRRWSAGARLAGQERSLHRFVVEVEQVVQTVLETRRR